MKIFLVLLVFTFINNTLSAQPVFPVPLDSIINPSLELSLSTGGWEKTGITSNISTGSSSNPIPYRGTNLLRISADGASLRQQLSPMYKGHRYKVTVWVYNHGTLGIKDIGRFLPYETSTAHGSSWKQISVEFISTGAPAILYGKFGPGSGKTYFDVFEAMDISASGDSVQNAPVNQMVYPASLLDLTRWKITLPINDAEEIFNPTLLDYSIDPWFKLVTDNDGWAVQFRANHGGATTSGSKNPRSELREMALNYKFQNSKGEYNWSTSSGKHIMWIKQKVTRLTYVKPHTVTGQIHGSGDDITVFRVEGYNGGSSGNGGTVGNLDTLARIWITNGNNSHGYLVDSAYRIGTVYEVKFIAQNGAIEYEYNGKKVPYKLSKNASGCYFKLGNYTQSNSDTAPNEVDSAYAETYVYDYYITHENSTGTDESEAVYKPEVFELKQNYPNPFNPLTTINYELQITNYVELKIYDMLGREIETLVNKVQQPGKYSIKWNAGNHSSGVYLYELKAGSYRKIQKMVLAK